MEKSITNLIYFVNKFRSLQNKNGSIDRFNDTEAHNLLISIIPIIRNITYETKQSTFFEAFEQDIQKWIAIGLNVIPDFSTTRDSFITPVNGQTIFFIGVVKSQNSECSNGYFLDCFVCQRVEPEECKALYSKYPHPKNICQSTKLINGSKGFAEGNCIVFFPENILCNSKIKKQNYALFFFSKFYNIYSKQTLVNTLNTLSNIEELKKSNLWSDFASYSEEDIYKSRCIWGYLHDYFHHIGIRPFDQNISLKMNWFVGLLEEIKVDMQTFLACRTNPDIPYGHLVAQYIMYDRMFRYPFQDDALENFDSGTGFFLFNYLFNEKGIRNENSKFIIDTSILDTSVQKMVAEIEDIEKLDDKELIIKSAHDFINKFIKVSSKRKITDIGFYKIVLKN